MNNLHFSVDDMWKIMTKQDDKYGLAYYEPEKQYFDFKKQKADRQRYDLNQKVWAKKDHYPSPNFPKDEKGNTILPKRPNFIEESIKQSRSNFSQAKFEAYVAKLKEKGKTLEDIENGPKQIKEKSPPKEKDEKNSKLKQRPTYLDDIYRREQKKNEIPKDMEEIVKKVEEKHKKLEEFGKDKQKIKIRNIDEDK
jgi:hypothetical protein